MTEAPRDATKKNQSHASSAERRLTHFANHILLQNPSPISPTVPPSLRLSPASATPTDTYQRVHGEVSIEPITWTAACDEYGKEFTDIVYEKADGEGIAKVSSWIYLFLLFGLYILFIYSFFIDHNQSTGEKERLPTAHCKGAYACF